MALTTLMNERTAIGGSAGTDAPRRGGQALDAVKIWKDLPSDERTDVRRDRLAQLWIRRRDPAPHEQAGRPRSMKAGNPGPEGSVAKLGHAELNKALYEFCIDLLGMDGQVGYDYSYRRADELDRERRRSMGRARTPSCGCGRTRSRAARRRSCATSSVNRSSACRASHAWTRTFRGRRFPGAERRFDRSSTHRAGLSDHAGTVGEQAAEPDERRCGRAELELELLGQQEVAVQRIVPVDARSRRGGGVAACTIR